MKFILYYLVFDTFYNFFMYFNHEDLIPINYIKFQSKYESRVEPKHSTCAFKPRYLLDEGDVTKWMAAKKSSQKKKFDAKIK